MSNEVLYPARYPTVIAVGSVNQNLKRSDFSYYGSDLEFVAPGENIFSTFNGSDVETYAEASGTSMASPFVSGMAALYKQAYPSLRGTSIRTYMQKSALDLGKKGKDSEYGYGLVQLPNEKDVRIFPDVGKGSWYEKEVNDLFFKGLFKETKMGSLIRAIRLPRRSRSDDWQSDNLPGEKTNTAFSDVSKGHFASGYIKSATSSGNYLRVS